MNGLTMKTEITQRKLNLEDMVKRFTQFVDVSEASIRSYKHGVKLFLRYLSNNGINNPTRETVLQYKKELTQSKSANTIALYLSSLRRFFAWCESEGVYPNITAGVKSPRIDTGHKKDAFSAQQLKKIISGIERKGIKGKRDYAIFALTAATGLRTCEVIRANVGDIRTVNGETVLYVQGNPQRVIL